MAGWVLTRRVFPKWTMVERGFSRGVHTDIVPKIGVLALAPLKEDNVIVTRQFCNCAKEALRITKPQKEYWRWHRNFFFDGIITRLFFFFFLQLHERGITNDSCWRYWHGTVIAIRMERMSRDADKRLSLLACAVTLLLSKWKQNEQRNETVFELGKNN